MATRRMVSGSHVVMTLVAAIGTILAGNLTATVTGAAVRKMPGHLVWLCKPATGTAVMSVAFAPDGRTILTGSEDMTARLWDAASGREIRRLTGHGDEVTSVAFAPDGRTILTGSKDKTARLWDAASGREIRRLEGHGDEVTSVAFAPTAAPS